VEELSAEATRLREALTAARYWVAGFVAAVESAGYPERARRACADLAVIDAALHGGPDR
jgi:uncharacterized protein (UPF0264 family)